MDVYSEWTRMRGEKLLGQLTNRELQKCVWLFVVCTLIDTSQTKTQQHMLLLWMSMLTEGISYSVNFLQ